MGALHVETGCEWQGRVPRQHHTDLCSGRTGACSGCCAACCLSSKDGAAPVAQRRRRLCHTARAAQLPLLPLKVRAEMSRCDERVCARRRRPHSLSYAPGYRPLGRPPVIQTWNNCAWTEVLACRGLQHIRAPRAHMRPDTSAKTQHADRARRRGAHGVAFPLRGLPCARRPAPPF